MSLYRGSLRAEKKALGKAVWSLYTEEIISVLGNQVLYWRINFCSGSTYFARQNELLAAVELAHLIAS